MLAFENDQVKSFVVAVPACAVSRAKWASIENQPPKLACQRADGRWRYDQLLMEISQQLHSPDTR